MAIEVATMRLVRANPAMPVPAVLHHAASGALCDAPWFFMEKMPGENLDHVRATLAPEEAEAVDRHLGAILRELDTFRGDWFGYAGHATLRAATWRPAFLSVVESVLEDAARKSVRFERPAAARWHRPVSPTRCAATARRRSPTPSSADAGSARCTWGS